MSCLGDLAPYLHRAHICNPQKQKGNQAFQRMSSWAARAQHLQHHVCSYSGMYMFFYFHLSLLRNDSYILPWAMKACGQTWSAWSTLPKCFTLLFSSLNARPMSAGYMSWWSFGKGMVIFSISDILILLGSEAPGLALGNPSKCRKKAHDPTGSDLEDDLADFDGKDPSKLDQHSSSLSHASHTRGRHHEHPNHLPPGNDMYEDDDAGADPHADYNAPSGSNSKSSLLLPWYLLQVLDSRHHHEQEHRPTTLLTTPPHSPPPHSPPPCSPPPQQPSATSASHAGPSSWSHAGPSAKPTGRVNRGCKSTRHRRLA